MKKITLFIIASIFSLSIFSQTIPNAGFETWVNNLESGHTYSVPQHWVTSDMLATAFKPAYVGTAVTKTTSSSAGSFAVLLQTCINAGDTVPGEIFSADSLSQVVTAIFGGKTMGFPFTLRPANFTGAYKFTKAGGDSAYAGVILTKYNTVTHHRDTLVEAALKVGANAGSYTTFSVPLTYAYNEFPDTCLVIASITGPNGAKSHVGTMFYLDALAFSGTVPVGINELPADNKFVSLFPNPFNEATTIQIDSKIQLNKTSFKIYDVLGNEVRNLQNISSHNFLIEKNDLPGGIYFYTLINNGTSIANGKFVVE